MSGIGVRPVAIITGGGSGMGRAIALDLAGDHHVVVVGRRLERVREVADQIGPAATARACDVSRRDHVEQLVADVLADHQRIDVLVNCAAVLPPRLLTSMCLEEAEQIWSGQLTANATSQFLMCFAVAPHLPRPGGRIITFGSEGTYTGGINPGATAYIAAKGAVHGLTVALARELSPEGITVNMVVPGIVGDTDLSGQLTDAGRAQYASHTAVGRIGAPDEIAAGVRYLVSPRSGFTTGQLLTINGGTTFGH